MTIRVGINGFGRIGREYLRYAADHDDIEVVAVNDITDVVSLARLLRHDSTFGPFPKEVEVRDDMLVVDGRKVAVSAIREPGHLAWAEYGVDVAIESTGKFRTRDAAAAHLTAGASRVLISAPGKGVDATIVMGVNDEIFDAKSHYVISNASCTTNCVAPMVKVLHEAFGFEQGFMTTVHAYTNDQGLFDHPHKDARRGRMAPMNIVPTSTGAAKALGLVIPDLKGKLEGLAFRVPVPSGSVVDLTVITRKKPAVEEIHAAMRRAADGPMKGILQVTTDPIVSADVIGNPHSSIYDSLLTQVPQEDMVKIIAWYDNEWGYAMRLVDLVAKVAALN
jgi:glyceraldehyde 3-phosphate dehydrogenase